jgi:hypothetical protein
MFPSLTATAGSFARRWNVFFHAPCDGRIVAAVRMAYAAVVLVHLAVLYPDLNLFFTDAGLLPMEVAQKIVSPYAWSIFFWLPSTAAVVHACFWVAVAHAVLLLVGFVPRLNALLLFVWLLSFQVRNPIIQDGEDCLMRLMGFFIIFLPSGACWSVNRLLGLAAGTPLARGEPQPIRPSAPETACTESACSGPAFSVPGWPLRLLQIEMAAMFLSTALVKLSGHAWLSGTALYYVSRLDDHFGRFPTPAWVFDTPLLVAGITWFVLLAETLVPLLIWFRETRLPCLAVLLVFHLANEWTMNLFLFHWLMICGWIAFLTPADFAWLGRTGPSTTGALPDRQPAPAVEAAEYAGNAM